MAIENFDMYLMEVAAELIVGETTVDKLIGKAIVILRNELRKAYDAGYCVRHAADMVDDYIMSEPF
jgi:hypothetical protein